MAAKDPQTNYTIGSVLNHVLMHQTVIGEEAILQMNLMDYAFFMFLEAKSLTYQTVYKCSNGDYGVLIGIEVW